MCAESLKSETIHRQNLEYLTCSSCGVVFASSKVVHSCPICAKPGNTEGAFLPYSKSCNENKSH